MVGLITGAVSSYLITTLIQWKSDKRNHELAKNKLSSYLLHVFDEFAVIQQKHELLEECEGELSSPFDFGPLIRLLALAKEYISIDYTSDNGKQLLNEITDLIESIYESCFENNLTTHLESKAIIELCNYQNKVIEYSKSVQKIAFDKKWWKAI